MRVDLCYFHGEAVFLLVSYLDKVQFFVSLELVQGLLNCGSLCFLFPCNFGGGFGIANMVGTAFHTSLSFERICDFSKCLLQKAE